MPVDRGYGVRTVRRPLLTTGRFPDRRLRLLFASTGTACLSPWDGHPCRAGDHPLLPLEHTLAACSPSGGGVYAMWRRISARYLPVACSAWAIVTLMAEAGYEPAVPDRRPSGRPRAWPSRHRGALRGPARRPGADAGRRCPAGRSLPARRARPAAPGGAAPHALRPGRRGVPVRGAAGAPGLSGVHPEHPRDVRLGWPVPPVPYRTGGRAGHRGLAAATSRGATARYR